MTATRLDPLLQLREREEEQARLGLARALEATRAARERLRLAEEAALRNDFSAGSAADWEMREVANARARAEVEDARNALLGALEAEERARVLCAEAHKRVEAVRRVAEARREEARVEEERKERKVFDEIGARSHHQRHQGRS